MAGFWKVLEALISFITIKPPGLARSLGRSPLLAEKLDPASLNATERDKTLRYSLVNPPELPEFFQSQALPLFQDFSQFLCERVAINGEALAGDGTRCTP